MKQATISHKLDLLNNNKKKPRKNKREELSKNKKLKEGRKGYKSKSKDLPNLLKIVVFET